jgi:hypothetical protein
VWKLVFSWKPDNQEKMAGIHFTTLRKTTHSPSLTSL